MHPQIPNFAICIAHTVGVAFLTIIVSRAGATYFRSTLHLHSLFTYRQVKVEGKGFAVDCVLRIDVFLQPLVGGVLIWAVFHPSHQFIPGAWISQNKSLRSTRASENQLSYYKRVVHLLNSTPAEDCKSATRKLYAMVCTAASGFLSGVASLPHASQAIRHIL